MDKQDFIARVFANPGDDAQDIRDAASARTELATLRASIRDFDKRMQDVMNTVPVPEGLAARLKARIHSEPAVERAGPRRLLSATGNYGWFAMAASLVLASGVAISLLLPPAAPTETELAMGQGAIRHVLLETADLASTGNVAFSTVSQVVANLGGRIEDNALTRELPIVFAKPCLILPGEIGAHFVMQGEQGQVDVMLLHNAPVDAEFQLQDERFSGMVSPLGTGNLVLIGESDEMLESYRNILLDNIDWVI